MPLFKHRGIMLDPARLMEHKAYYFFLLPWLKEWGYTAVQLHLTDDQGCAMAFPSHPELARRDAFQPDEMRDFVRKAGKLGLEVIPEIESFGHTRCITAHPAFRHLGDRGGNAFTAIDPDHPDTFRVLDDLFRDASRLFESPIVHAGLDEVDISGLPRYRRLPKAEHWKVFARHMKWVLGCIRSHGKRPAMWGDHVLSAPQLASRIGRDVLIFDWHYDPGITPASLEFFRKKGFEVWGAPSTLCWASRVVSNRHNMGNLRDFSAVAIPMRKKGVSGMMNTVWCPWRYLTGAMDWPMALAGHLFSAAEEDPSFCRDFCGNFYGLSSAAADLAARSIQRLHARAPDCWFYDRVIAQGNPALPIHREDRRKCRVLLQEFKEISTALKTAVSRARRNQSRLADVLFSSQILERWACRGAGVRYGAEKRLARDCVGSWNRQRYEAWAARARLEGDNDEVPVAFRRTR
ncbi:MAG: family 20 glycosylhydrolase [Lentisphaerae bacterium]|nr:family 20 glycosylhydrolase [Lentisphaerota bacterium]